MALVYISEKKQQKTDTRRKSLYSYILNYRTGLVLFILILLGAAWLEESIWNMLVWQEQDKKEVLDPAGFSGFGNTGAWLGLLVPLLVVPQVTHYILDAYIWRIRKNEI